MGRVVGRGKQEEVVRGVYMKRRGVKGRAKSPF